MLTLVKFGFHMSLSLENNVKATYAQSDIFFHECYILALPLTPPFFFCFPVMPATANTIRVAEFHRRAVVELRRRADHNLHHQPQGEARPGADTQG